MSENSKPTPQNEEVDLGQLFKVIGNVFQKLYDFIASIFKGLFGVLILILAHFYKRAKFYALALVIGLCIGYFIDKSSDKEYGANMFIETNFNSAYQVYENILNLNELASTGKDSLRLAELLDISVSDASKLSGFYIGPDIDPNQTIKMFSDYKRGIDSISALTVSFETFEESLSNYSFRTHKIGVNSSDKNIYPKLRGKLSKLISQNDYLDALLEVNQQNYVKNSETIIKQDQKLDSLINQYLEIRVKESQKEPAPGAGTNLFLGNTTESKLLINEAPLLNQKLDLASQLRTIEELKVKNKNIISVLSDFPSSGYSISKWYEKNTVVFGALFLIITLIIFVFIELGKYLKKQGAI